MSEEQPTRHTVEFSNAARRQFHRLPRTAQQQLAPVIEALTTEPRPAGATFLRGHLRGYYRVRSGDYRVIYAIEDEVLKVLVVTVGHRREVYR